MEFQYRKKEGRGYVIKAINFNYEIAVLPLSTPKIRVMVVENRVLIQQKHFSSQKKADDFVMSLINEKRGE